MYFILPIIFVIIIILIITILITSYDSNAPLLVLLLLFVPLLLVYLFNVSYKTAPPKLINKSKISVMHDKYVVIVRIGDEYQETFTSKYEYDNIISGKFTIKKQNIYNIFGGLNDTDYIVTINK